LGPDAAVLALADENSAALLPASLRFVCRLPVAGATRLVDRDELVDLADRWAVRGRRLFVVSDTAGTLTRLLGPVRVDEFVARNDRHPVATLKGPPDRLQRLDVFWAVALVRR
ncbi:MAG: hypothetical protein ABIW46_04405, partial [Acidimicrobiales bacterium]